MENRFHNIVAYQTVGDKQSWTRLSSASLSTKLYLQKLKKALIIEKKTILLNLQLLSDQFRFRFIKTVKQGKCSLGTQPGASSPYCYLSEKDITWCICV